ncbi:helix-turn-helix transcriptional regulator, partial [Peptacetobacter sp.]
MTLSEKISNLRKQKGWSQEELGEHLEVSRQSVS